MLAEGAFALRVGLVAVDELQDDEPAGQSQGGLDRVGQPAPGLGLDGEAVDDDLDRVLLLLLQGGHVLEPDHDAVDADARVALGLQLAEQVGVLPLALAHHRREHLEARARGQFQHLVDDLLRGLPGDHRTADRAVGHADAGVQQPQVVVDLGDRAHRRARVAGCGLLVDGHRRGQSLDEVDVGLVHLAEELAGVRRQALDVATLALGEDRVEREAGLARPRQPREDDQGVAREVERDVLEVVLTGPAYDQSLTHVGSSPAGRVQQSRDGASNV